jgi:nitric-oxide synthase
MIAPSSYFISERSAEQLAEEADLFIHQFCREMAYSADWCANRMAAIRAELAATGSYTHTLEELQLGARMAWRNSNRCIGRLFWKSLKVRDCRHITQADEAFQAMLEHLDLATNGGAIRPLISIFPPQRPDGHTPLKIWNDFIIRYAGYTLPDQGIVGDPDSVPFTRICSSMGWQSSGSSFDVLPLIIQQDKRAPQVFSLPTEQVLEVPISHPEYAWFDTLSLKWYALPLISGMVLEIGGIQYPTAPFNGWYMGTEIGARNLADEQRYNLLPTIAQALQLDTTHPATLWKDRALVELNRAVLFSFQQAGVKIVDHHTATQQFDQFQEIEQQHQRPVYGDWSWLVPPMSGATCPIFHKSIQDIVQRPNFFYRHQSWYAGTDQNDA